MEQEQPLVFDGDIPCCPLCGKRMINSVDSTDKKINHRLWQTDCEHYKNIRLSVG